MIRMFDAHEPADALGKPNASGGRSSISSSTGLPLLRCLLISFQIRIVYKINSQVLLIVSLTPPHLQCDGLLQ